MPVTYHSSRRKIFGIDSLADLLNGQPQSLRFTTYSSLTRTANFTLYEAEPIPACTEITAVLSELSPSLHGPSVHFLHRCKV